MESRLLFFASPEAPSDPEKQPGPIPELQASAKEELPSIGTKKKELAADLKKREDEEKAKEGDPDQILLRGLTFSEEAAKKGARATNGTVELTDRQKSIADDLAQLPLANENNRKAIIDRIIAAGPVSVRPLLDAIRQTGDGPRALYRPLLRQLLNRPSEYSEGSAGEFVERALMQRQPITSADVEELGPHAIDRLGDLVTGFRWGANALVPNRVSPEEEAFLRSRAVALLRPLMHLPEASRAVGDISELPADHGNAALEAIADLRAESIDGLRRLSFTANGRAFAQHQSLAMRALLSGLRRNGQRIFERASSTGRVRSSGADIIENLKIALASPSPEIRTLASEALQIMLSLPDTVYEEDSKRLPGLRESVEWTRKLGVAVPPVAFRRLCQTSSAAEAIQTSLTLLQGNAGVLQPADKLRIIESVRPSTLGVFSPENAALRKQWIATIRSLRNDTNEEVRKAAEEQLRTIEQLETTLVRSR